MQVAIKSESTDTGQLMKDCLPNILLQVKGVSGISSLYIKHGEQVVVFFVNGTPKIMFESVAGYTVTRFVPAPKGTELTLTA